MVFIILVLGGFTFTIIKKFKGRTTKVKVVLILRSIMLTLFILCLVNFGIRNVSDTTTTIFLVDGSDSTSDSKGIEEDFINSSLENMT